ncbi:MAG: acyl carrier protein [Candidatus Dormibacteria bacterium]
MTTLDIEALRKSVADELRIPIDQITDTADFIDDLKVDSLGVVELALSLEREFGIVIPDEDLTKIRTLNSLREYVESHGAVTA